MNGIHRKVVLTIIIALFLCGNIFGPGLFWNAYGKFSEQCGFFATGALVSEACLLAIWCALGALAVKYRLPLTGAILLVSVCCYVIGLRLPDDTMPMEVAIIVICSSVMMFFCMQVPLWIMRAITQRQIDLPSKDGCPDSQYGSSQFGLGYLMICTAVVGVLLVIIKHSLPESNSFDGNAPWVQIFGALSVFMLFSAIICLPCAWLAFAEKYRVFSGVWLFIALFLGPLIVFSALDMIFGLPNDMEPVIGIFSFGLGGGVSTLLVLFIARLLGYRLLRPTIEPSAPKYEIKQFETVRPLKGLKARGNTTWSIS